MAPRILTRNEEALAAAAEPALRARLWSERAILLARILDPAGAAQALEQARRCAAQADDGAQADVQFAQAVCRTFRHEHALAIDELRALRLQARHAGRVERAAACAAVLALCHLQRGELTELVALATVALDEAAADAWPTRYRAHLSLGMAHYFAGNFSAAHRSFEQARQAARACDDEVALASLLEAAVIAQATEARQQAAAGSLSTEELRQALVAIQAAIQNDLDAGIHKDVSAERLIEAELHLRSGDRAAALRLVQAHLETAAALDLVPHHALGLAVRAVCRATDDPAAARADAQAAVARASQMSVPEVLAPVLGLAVQALEEAGHAAEAAPLRQRASGAWNDLVQRQRQARAALARVPAS
jgi:hypothetical protein